MNKDFYGFYCDIESNRLLNDEECVMFIPTAAIKTVFHQTVFHQTVFHQTVFVNPTPPVVKQPVVVKQSNPKTTTTKTILHQERQLKPNIVKPDFIQNLTQNIMKISFCIFLTIILYK